MKEPKQKWQRRQSEFSRRDFLRVAGLASTVGPLLLGCRRKSSQSESLTGFRVTKKPPAELRDLNMLCWTDNALDEYVQPFEEEYGVRINRTYFEGNANAFERMKLGGNEIFDIVQSDALWPQEYAREGLIDPLNPADYPDSYPYLWECFQQPAYQMHEGRWYAFPNAWDAVGVGYNTERVQPAPTGFGDLWDEKYKGRVAFPIVEDNTVQVAALHLGYDNIYCLSTEQLAECERVLLELRNLSRKMYTDLIEIEQLLGSGEAWLGLVVISWVILKLKRAGLPYELFTPRPTQGWVDNYMIASGSANKEMAKFFINWYTSPISQLNFIRVGSKRSCQAGVRQFLSPEEIAFFGMGNPEETVNSLLLYEPTCRAEEYARILARLKA